MNEMQTKIDNKKKSIENAKNEVAVTKKQLLEIDTKFPIMQRELAIRRANAELIYKGFKILKPTWEYETDPEYLANLLELNRIAFLKVEEDFAALSEKIIKTKADQEAHVKEAEEYIALLEKEVEELEKVKNNE